MMTVPVRVTDGDGGEATGSTTVTVDNVAPTVDAPVVDIEPSNEDQEVIASATFIDPGTEDTHTCTVDYDDGNGPQAGTVHGLTCFGPAHTYLDDDPSGTASDVYTITVVVTDDDDGSDDNSAEHTVNNVDPVIHDITTDAPVPQGQPVTVTVDASDVGIHDVLTFSFDCDGDGIYETPGAGNQGACLLNPSAASSTLGVQVMDDDLGADTGTVVVSQQVTLCVHYGTGAVRGTGPGGSCNGGTAPMTLPAAYPHTFCASVPAGGLRWSVTGACSPGERLHIVPNDGPLHYCEHSWLGSLRIPQLPGQCSAYETPGVIPG
jgi:hypothetical protein